MPCQAISINNVFAFGETRMVGAEEPILIEKWTQRSRLIFCVASAMSSWIVTARFVDLALGI